MDEKRQPNPCYTHYAFTVPPAEFTAMSHRIIDSGAPVFKDNTSPGDSLYFLRMNIKLEIQKIGRQISTFQI